MNKAFCALSLSAALAMSTATYAQAESAAPNTGALSIGGGVDYTTAYFFRGYNQEDSGLILQPYAELEVSLVQRDDVGVSAKVGIWNSFHENQTGAADTGPSSWYESDLYGGIDFAISDFTLGVVYTFYHYPGPGLSTVQEVGITLGYDDSALAKRSGWPIAFSPFVGIYMETDNTNVAHPLPGPHIYGEVGVAPSFPLGATEITISLPMALGFSLDEYFVDDDGDNELLGYGSVSLMGSMPLPMPSRYGQWSFVAGVQYLHLFADSAESANAGDNSEFIGKIGVSFSY